jgi:hypothetical protein
VRSFLRPSYSLFLFIKELSFFFALCSFISTDKVVRVHSCWLPLFVSRRHGGSSPLSPTSFHHEIFIYVFILIYFSGDGPNTTYRRYCYEPISNNNAIGPIFSRADPTQNLPPGSRYNTSSSTKPKLRGGQTIPLPLRNFCLRRWLKDTN